jgi:serpin B
VTRTARTPHLAVAAASVALAACGTTGATPPTHPGDVGPVEAGALTARDAAQSQTAFGVDLLHAVGADAASVETVGS